LKVFSYLMLIAFGVLMLYAASGLPDRGDANAPANRDRSLAQSPGAANYYIKNAYKDADTPNMVTVILADYRSYDTLGEVTVIFTAGMVCYLILRRKKDGKAK